MTSDSNEQFALFSSLKFNNYILDYKLLCANKYMQHDTTLTSLTKLEGLKAVPESASWHPIYPEQYGWALGRAEQTVLLCRTL